MAKQCSTQADVKLLAVNAQSRSTRIRVQHAKPIFACYNIRADKFYSIDSQYTFNALQRIHDLLNCRDGFCIPRGVLNITASGGEVVYKVTIPVKDFGAGVITFNTFVTNLNTGVPVNLNVRISNDETFENYTEYSAYSGNPGTNEFSAQADLSKPIEVEGNGWEKTPNAPTYIMIVNNTPASAGVGIGNIQLFGSRDVFEQNVTGIISCPSEVEFNTNFDLTDDACLGQRPDPTSTEVSGSITATYIDPVLFETYATLDKSEDTEYFDFVDISETVQDGKIELPDFSTEACGGIAAYLDDCNADEGRLTYSSLRNAQSGYTFTVTEDLTTGVHYANFDSSLEGEQITVTYPKVIEADVFDIVGDVEDKNYAIITIPVDYTNGYRRLIEIYGYFTEIPFGYSTSELTEFELSFTAIKRNGKYGHFIIDKSQPANAYVGATYS